MATYDYVDSTDNQFFGGSATAGLPAVCGWCLVREEYKAGNWNATLEQTDKTHFMLHWIAGDGPTEEKFSWRIST